MAKDLRVFLNQVKSLEAGNFAEVNRSIEPNKFEVTAILEHLTKAGRYPLVQFSNPKNLYGEDAGIPLISNVFATRERCALALDWSMDQSKLPLSLEFARLQEKQIPAQVIDKKEAAVKEIVIKGEEVDCAKLPIVRHYEKDLGPVITMTCAMKDPDTGAYNVSFIKTFYKKDPRKLGISIHSPHHERILAKYEERGESAPVINILGHHPAFLLGSLALNRYEDNDYDSIGSFLGEPLRLVPSETWGDEFLVPADAEIVIEGEIPPGVREIVDPFGEVTRHYQAQCLRPVMNVTAMTRRKDAIMQDMFSGHEEHWNLGAIPKEGSVFNALKSKVGNVTAVHCPHSGIGRLSCYISVDKKREGDVNLTGLAALSEYSNFQAVVIVDKDIDVFDEKEVIWAVLTTVDPKKDITYVPNIQTVFTTAMGFGRVIIDATVPLNKAFPEKFKVPDEAMQRIRLEEWII
ncbi:MAG: UbiD family decarboxylase [Clostridia bacterium]|jgi:UbiD family decarboxylase|nr:UbiD family decarboxylase [Clostridia bacterium]